MKKMKTNKASILVFSLIILFMVLSIALGITGTTIISQKMSGTTGSSTQAFQTADSGVEIILKKISDADDADKLSSIGTCSVGKIKGYIGSGEYNIIFFNENGDQLTDCNTLVTEVDRIKSIGSYANTTRAVEMAVAAGDVPPGTLCGSVFYEGYAGDTTRVRNNNIQNHAKCDGDDVVVVVSERIQDNCPSDYVLTRLAYSWGDDPAYTYNSFSCAKK